MSSHRKLIMIVVGSLIGILFLGSVALLWQKVSESRKANISLRKMQAEQTRLYNRDPFPSQGNIARENNNLVAIRDEYAKLVKTLREGEIGPVEQSPNAFSAQFWKTQKELLAEAREKGVKLPDEANYHFGFQRYMAGVLPAIPDVPRLTQQLTIIQELCRVFYDSKIIALQSVRREEFEGGASAASAAPVSIKETGAFAEGSLYGRMHFAFGFTARESSLREALNRLARHGTMVVVTRLELSGDPKAGPSAKTTTATPPAEGAAAEPGTAAPKEGQPAKQAVRDDRIVCGGRDNPVEVKIEVDVYRFRPVEDGKRS